MNRDAPEYFVYVNPYRSEEREGRMKDTDVYWISVTVTNISKGFCSFASDSSFDVFLDFRFSFLPMTTRSGQQMIPKRNN